MSNGHKDNLIQAYKSGWHILFAFVMQQRGERDGVCVSSVSGHVVLLATTARFHLMVLILVAYLASGFQMNQHNERDSSVQK
jgi:hypothetical protein